MICIVIAITNTITVINIITTFHDDDEEDEDEDEGRSSVWRKHTNRKLQWLDDSLREQFLAFVNWLLTLRRSRFIDSHEQTYLLVLWV